MVRDRRFFGLKFRRQHQMGLYIVDFYCHERKLVAELDGAGHDEPSQHTYDINRDDYLHSFGCTFSASRTTSSLPAPTGSSAISPPSSIFPIIPGSGNGGEASTSVPVFPPLPLSRWERGPGGEGRVRKR
ncbi:MAG TPA: endonuclease domain-containing protein [Armatimonadota bacterium]|nr:endonuclease domain-containing protein [Armatimonadota bacterium]